MRITFTLYLFLLLFLSFTINAQVYYEQDFEEGMGDMIVHELTGQPLYPQYEHLQDGWGLDRVNFCTYSPVSNVAMSSANFLPGYVEPADVWLITPEISLNNEDGNILYWQTISQVPALVKYEVLVSETGTKPTDFLDMIYEVDGEEMEDPYTMYCKERNVSLDAYKGKSIRIAFRNIAVSGWLSVDNISVANIAADRAEIIKVDGLKYQLQGSSFPISGSVKNVGSDVIESIEMSWSYLDSVYTQEFIGLNILLLDTFFFRFDKELPISFLTEEIINVKVVSVNGTPYEDSSAIHIHGLTEIPIQYIVYEMDVATWNENSPAGYCLIPYLEYRYDNFIPIAVHNPHPDTTKENPMSVSGYSTGSTSPFYPRFTVNRVFNDGYASGNLNDNKFKKADTLLRPPMGISGLATYYDSDDRIVEIECRAQFYGKFFNSDFRFSVILLEDTIRGTGSEYRQANNFSNSFSLNCLGLNFKNEPNPVPAEKMVYNNVARSILGEYEGIVGSIPASISAGDIFNYSFAYKVPEHMNPQNMKAIILVLDGDTGAIVNARTAKFDFSTNTNTLNNILQKLKIYPNPTTGGLTIELNRSDKPVSDIRIINSLGQVVKTIKIPKGGGAIRFYENLSEYPPGIYTVTYFVGGILMKERVVLL